MKKFKCNYRDETGCYARPEKKISAESVEEAARIFAEEHPSEYPEIEVSGGLRLTVISNKEQAEQLRIKREKTAQKLRLEEEDKEKRKRELAQRAQKRQEAALVATRLESLQKLHSSVKRADGNLAELSCSELDALVENLKDFPDMDETVSAEERAVREELYKVAFFNRHLQAGLHTKEAKLQTEIQRQLLAQLKSALTRQQTAGAAGSGTSKIAAAAALGGLAALQKLNQIEDNTGDVSEGLRFDE